MASNGSPRPGAHVLSLGLYRGAGDENRIRTGSLEDVPLIPGPEL